MKVIVCGAGQVGFNIARHLALENNDVIVVDQKPELVRRVTDTLDATGFVGHASNPEVLELAGIAVRLDQTINRLETLLTEE